MIHLAEYNPYTVGIVDRGHTIAANPYLFDIGLTPDEITRVQDVLTYFQFYKGQHWKHKRPDGEPQVTANYAKAFVDKGVAFLAGKGFTINVESEAEQVTKPFLDYVWDDNNRELRFIEIAQMGGISGDAFVMVGVEEFDPEEEPFMYELYPKGRIRITLIPSNLTFPRYDAHDKEKMVSIDIVYRILSDEAGKVKEYWYRKHINRKEIIEYMGDKLVSRQENKLGEVPVVHIQNIPVAGDIFGQSDIRDIIPLNKEFNEKATDISDIINYHAAPVTVIKGARASKIERGARKVWGGLPKDADVFNLELKSDLSAALNYLEMLKMMMFEIGKIPETALGKKSHISNTSGVALHVENQPLMELTRIKQKSYGKGLEEINRLILRLGYLIEHPELDIQKFEKLKPKEKYSSYIEFPDPLPKDELIQMQLIAQKIALNLQTRLDALKELGEYNAKEKLEEIKQELIEWNELLMEAGLGMMQTQKAANKTLQTNIGGEVSREEKADPNNKKKD